MRKDQIPGDLAQGVPGRARRRRLPERVRARGANAMRCCVNATTQHERPSRDKHHFGARALRRRVEFGILRPSGGLPCGRFPDVPPGTYRVQAQIIGYALGEVTGVVVTAGQTTTADFQLTQLAVALQEIVVVGYGTQVRRDVTGSVASVGTDDVHEVPKVNVIEAIKGRVPGVDVVTTGNKPGDGIRVRLRGERSLKASNDPLYVLDGIPMAGGVGDLNPRDIESIEVLKDASATAIYGSRGANGVVLITTRKGRAGATNVTYDSYAGYQAPLRRVPLFNGPEFAEYRREAERARNNYKCAPGVAVCDSADAKLLR